MELPFAQVHLQVPRLTRGCFTANKMKSFSDSCRCFGMSYSYLAEMSRFGKFAREKEPVLDGKCLSDPIFLSYISTYKSHSQRSYAHQRRWPRIDVEA